MKSFVLVPMKIVFLENMNNSKPFETLSHFSRSVPNFLRGGIIIKQARHGRMWQRANGFFDCTYVCRTTKRNLSLFHQKLFAIRTSLRSNKIFINV